MLGEWYRAAVRLYVYKLLLGISQGPERWADLNGCPGRTNSRKIHAEHWVRIMFRCHEILCTSTV